MPLTEGGTPGIAEPCVDNEPERLADPDRVSGVTVRRKASFYAGRIHEDGQTAMCAVPELVVTGQQRAAERCATSVDESEMLFGIPFAHRP